MSIFNKEIPNRSLINVRQITFGIINPVKNLIKFKAFHIVALSFLGVGQI